MTVNELSRDQLTQLKQAYYMAKHEEQGVSYDELADIDELVTDSEIIEEYAGVTFTADDFTA